MFGFFSFFFLRSVGVELGLVKQVFYLDYHFEGGLSVPGRASTCYSRATEVVIPSTIKK